MKETVNDENVSTRSENHRLNVLLFLSTISCTASSVSNKSRELFLKFWGVGVDANQVVQCKM